MALETRIIIGKKVRCMHEMKAKRGCGARHHFGLRNPILHENAMSNNNSINDKYYETLKRTFRIEAAEHILVRYIYDQQEGSIADKK